MASSTPTYKLVTVNNAPERAKKVIGRVADELKDRYNIDYVANCIGKEEVESKVKEFQPDILFCASMWTVEESNEMREIAESIIPGIKTYAIPQGLQVEKGPEGVVEHLVEEVPKLLG